MVLRSVPQGDAYTILQGQPHGREQLCVRRTRCLCHASLSACTEDAGIGLSHAQPDGTSEMLGLACSHKSEGTGGWRCITLCSACSNISAQQIA